MSTSQHVGGSGDPGSHQSEDEIDFKKVIAVGVVSLVLFAICTVWAIAILRGETARLTEERGETAPALLAGQTEIGIVDQVPFENDHRLEIWRKERSSWLNEYGWVDRKRGIIHIPIDKAMEQIVGGAQPSVSGGKK